MTLGRILIAIDNLYDNRLEKGLYSIKLPSVSAEDFKEKTNKDQKEKKQEKDKDKRRAEKDKRLRELKYGVQ